MSNPFRRSRGSDDIIRPRALPMRTVTPSTATRRASRRTALLSSSSASNRLSLRGDWVRLLVVLLSTSMAGCAPSSPIPPHRPPEAGIPALHQFDSDQRERLDVLHAALDEGQPSQLPPGLVVRLAFDDAADLDLFVTDPAQESVYFANSPTRSGGILIEDQHCGHLSPRVEIVHYATPRTGRYRVGVDFHRLCDATSLSDEAAQQGLYVVRVDNGSKILRREGLVTLGRFEVIVLEFDVE